MERLVPPIKIFKTKVVDASVDCCMGSGQGFSTTDRESDAHLDLYSLLAMGIAPLAYLRLK